MDEIDASLFPCLHRLLSLCFGKASNPEGTANVKHHYDVEKGTVIHQPEGSKLDNYELSYTGTKQKQASVGPFSGEEKTFKQLTSQDDDETSQANKRPITEEKQRQTEGEYIHLKEKISHLETRLTEEQDKAIALCKEKDDKINQLKSDLAKQREQQQRLDKRKEEQIKDLSNRLAAEMGTKVASDESSLENISIKDRPMNIASEYELLCSNEWLTAKSELDEQKHLTEEKRLKLLCDILLIGLSEATDLKQSMMHGIGAVLSKPGITAVDDSKVSEGFSLSEKLMQNLMDLERQTVDETDLTMLTERIHKEVNSKVEDSCTQVILKSEAIVQYIKSVAVITWKMVLQRPPMSFRQDDIDCPWQGETKQEVFWSSSDPSDPDSRVVFYIHPALYHGEAMMVKGRVFLRNNRLVELITEKL